MGWWEAFGAAGTAVVGDCGVGGAVGFEEGGGGAARVAGDRDCVGWRTGAIRVGGLVICTTCTSKSSNLRAQYWITGCNIGGEAAAVALFGHVDGIGVDAVVVRDIRDHVEGELNIVRRRLRITLPLVADTARIHCQHVWIQPWL